MIIIIIEWKQGFKRDKPPADLPSLPPVCLSIIFTQQWKTLLALSPEELTLPRLLIKSQTLIIEQKHNLPSPPWVPQSNPWKHTHTHTRIHKHSPSCPALLWQLSKITRRLEGGVYLVCSLRSRPKTKTLNIINTGDNHMKGSATYGGTRGWFLGCNTVWLYSICLQRVLSHRGSVSEIVCETLEPQCTHVKQWLLIFLQIYKLKVSQSYLDGTWHRSSSATNEKATPFWAANERKWNDEVNVQQRPTFPAIALWSCYFNMLNYPTELVFSHWSKVTPADSRWSVLLGF